MISDKVTNGTNTRANWGVGGGAVLEGFICHQIQLNDRKLLL